MTSYIRPNPDIHCGGQLAWKPTFATHLQQAGVGLRPASIEARAHQLKARKQLDRSQIFTWHVGSTMDEKAPGRAVQVLKRTCFGGIAAFAILTAPLTFARDWLDLPDERDQYHEAYVYHVMVRTEAEAKEVFASLSAIPRTRLLPAFKAAAAAKSIDPGSSQAGGDLGLLKEGTMVRPFERAAFSTPAGQMSGPVKTEFGWHLVYVASLKVTPVVEVCAQTLRAHLKVVPGLPKDVEDLTNRGKPGTPAFEAQVARALGPHWGSPLKDMFGNLTFLRGGPIDAAGNAEVLQHTEYSYARLSIAPLACKRSERTRFKVSCTKGTVVAQSTDEQELRGGQGLVIHQRAASPEAHRDTSQYGGFFRQIHNLACKPAVKI